MTETGTTAQQISKYRPIAPVLAITNSAQTARQCQVLRGIYPVLVESMNGTENIIFKAMLTGVKLGMAKKGDSVVVISGNIEGKNGCTNVMRVMKCVGFEN